MQQESNAKNSKISRMSIQSFQSGLSNFSLIKDLAKRENAPNRDSFRQSLKYCMSVQSDKKSDIYQNLIEEEVKKNSVYGSGLGKQFKPDNSDYAQKQGFRRSYDGRYFGSDVTSKSGLPGSHITDQNSRSLLEKYKIMHTCLCSDKCQKDCPCYQATQDQCIMGICCPDCIQYKNRLLSTRRKLQKQGLDVDDLKPCTCKKTKCNKKYCSCFNAGKKCTNLCSCDECVNCDFYDYEPEKERKRSTFIEKQWDQKYEMPQKMDFQPVQFPQL